MKFPRLCHKLIYNTLVKTPVLPDIDAAQAEKYLLELHDDVRSSCIGRNEVNPNPKYDLQIIVPVYNVEEYLRECMDSIVGQQTSYSYKVVVVNDGSPDSSRKILEEYENLPNVEVIDQENRGFSGARNSGLRRIDARYVMFVDSDDSLTPDAIQALMNQAYAIDADVVLGSIIRNFNGKRFGGKRFNKDGAAPLDTTTGFGCGGVYRAKLWENLVFPAKYWFEDTIYSMIVTKKCAKMATVREIVYNYRSNPRGITQSSIGNVRTLDSLWITRSMLVDEERMGMHADRGLAERIYKQFLRQCRITYLRTCDLGEEVAGAVFIMLCSLYDKYFRGKGYQADGGFSELAKAVAEKDFKRFSYVVISCMC